MSGLGAIDAATLIATREQRFAGGLLWLNQLDAAAAAVELERCCGARRWAQAMVARRPFPTSWSLFAAAREEWNKCSREEVLEAFGHHPRIGDVDGLRKKFASTAAWASGEQSGATAASEQVLRALSEGNRVYQEKFGHIFIVCATGKSAGEMLALLQDRLPNPAAEELKIAAGEQDKITRLRLEKLLAARAAPAAAAALREEKP